MDDFLPPHDPWSSLRARLDAGPRPGDPTYSVENGALALWTLAEVRADYLQSLLDERDAAVAEVQRLRSGVASHRETHRRINRSEKKHTERELDRGSADIVLWALLPKDHE